MDGFIKYILTLSDIFKNHICIPLLNAAIVSYYRFLMQSKRKEIEEEDSKVLVDLNKGGL